MESPSETPPAFEHTLRRIAITGYASLVLTAAYFTLVAVVWPEPYGHVWKLALVHVVAGRAGNVALGIELGVPRWFLFFQCFIQDILALFILYPLVIAGYRRAVESRILGSTLSRVRTAANKHRTRMEPYGAIGLVAFVVFPLWSTGALVGAVIGYLLGIRTRVAFTAVIVGNLIAVGLWVMFFDRLYALNRNLTRGIIVVVVALALAAAIVAQLRRLSHARRHAEMLESGLAPANEHNDPDKQKRRDE